MYTSVQTVELLTVFEQILNFQEYNIHKYIYYY